MLILFKILLSFTILSIQWAQRFSFRSVIVLPLQPFFIWTRPAPRHIHFMLSCNNFQQAFLKNYYLFSALTAKYYPIHTPRHNKEPKPKNLKEPSWQHVFMYCMHQKLTASVYFSELHFGICYLPSLSFLSDGNTSWMRSFSIFLKPLLQELNIQKNLTEYSVFFLKPWWVAVRSRFVLYTRKTK